MPNSNKKLQQSHPTNTTNVAYETCWSSLQILSRLLLTIITAKWPSY
jgi:hypothetical protein